MNGHGMLTSNSVKKTADMIAVCATRGACSDRILIT